jgi:glycerophosphoryl diester phosphodiesterase
VAAHRGGAGLWPENSLLAFRSAIGLGVALLELDVHLTRDDRLVVIHDRALTRTTNGTGFVDEMTAGETRTLRLRDRAGAVTAERVPLLDEVLELVAPTAVGLLVEVKGPGPAVVYERADGRIRAVAGPRYEGLEARLIARLSSAGLADRVTVMGFNPAVVREVRRRAPEVATVLLFGASHLVLAQASAIEMLEVASELGVTAVGLEHTLVDADVITVARERGLGVNVWTVDDGALMARYAALGVDIVTTDRPDLGVEVLGRAREERTA